MLEYEKYNYAAHYRLGECFLTEQDDGSAFSPDCAARVKPYCGEIPMQRRWRQASLAKGGACRAVFSKRMPPLGWRKSEG